jgi:4-alpha-glucanotransferase
MMTKPLFDWLSQRSAGVLLHPTSLPGPYRSGNFGASARAFVDILADAGMRYWQMLPLGPTGFGDSPYQSYSSHAINPYLVDLDALVELGWLERSHLAPLYETQEGRVDFQQLRIHHAKIVAIAYENGLKDSAFTDRFARFLESHQGWVQDYALFMALRSEYDGATWSSWKKHHRDIEEARKQTRSGTLQKSFDLIQFEQFVLFEQWIQLKSYANARGVQIIGDIPIYVAYDSADVWASPAVFQLTKSGIATRLAGVPPDYFNADGQFWGNPLYDWKHLEATGYSWWIERLKQILKLCDVVRFDHFRGLADYWSIPAKAASAKEGKWMQGPGIAFFEAVKEAMPSARLILEDLGDITPDVIELKNQTGCPGLAVLQFAFGGGSDNFYLPHNIDRNTVVYTGTHDNDTSLGWYLSANEKEQDHMRRYLMVSGQDSTWDLIRAAYRSHANLAIIPAQDLLDLGTDARMNVPGLAIGNWNWRLTHDQMYRIGQVHGPYLREIAKLFSRD